MNPYEEPTRARLVMIMQAENGMIVSQHTGWVEEVTLSIEREEPKPLFDRVPGIPERLEVIQVSVVASDRRNVELVRSMNRPPHEMDDDEKARRDSAFESINHALYAPIVGSNHETQAERVLRQLVADGHLGGWEIDHE